MSLAIFHKLLAIFLTSALGWVVARAGWLGRAGDGSDPARVLSNAAFYLFIPALLFRATARLDFETLPWRTLAAFFGPAMLLAALVYAWQRHAVSHGRASAGDGVAAPSVRAITAAFGNTVQIGIPVALALFGEAGLGVHMMIVGLHALVLLTLLTALVELDLARERSRSAGASPRLASMLASTARATVIHPVVLPVLAGIGWNLTGLALPPVVDEVLLLLGSAVVPLCLVLLGMSLAYHGLRGGVRGAARLAALKLLGLPALVLPVAHWGFGLGGLPLAVVVMIAALPAGSNALIFAQRYRTLEREVTAAMVFSTLAFVLTAPLWLLLLRWLGW